MKSAAFLLILLPVAAAAGGRGGSCNTASCNLGAAMVLAVLLLLFIVSAYDSVREKGLFKGLVTNRAAQLVFGYLGMLLFIVGGSVAVEKLWGKYAAMWVLGGLLLSLMFGPAMMRKFRSRTRSEQSSNRG